MFCNHYYGCNLRFTIKNTRSNGVEHGMKRGNEIGMICVGVSTLRVLRSSCNRNSEIIDVFFCKGKNMVFEALVSISQSVLLKKPECDTVEVFLVFCFVDGCCLKITKCVIQKQVKESVSHRVGTICSQVFCPTLKVFTT